MWKDKKFIVIASLLVVLIAAVGTLGGLALARQNDNGIVKLQSARANILQQAKNFIEDNDLTPGEIVNETLDKYLQRLVEEEKITQEEADEFKAWWDSKPDIEGIFNFFSKDNFKLFGRIHSSDGVPN